MMCKFECRQIEELSESMEQDRDGALEYTRVEDNGKVRFSVVSERLRP